MNEISVLIKEALQRSRQRLITGQMMRISDCLDLSQNATPTPHPRSREDHGKGG